MDVDHYVWGLIFAVIWAVSYILDRTRQNKKIHPQSVVYSALSGLAFITGPACIHFTLHDGKELIMQSPSLAVCSVAGAFFVMAKAKESLRNLKDEN